MTPCSTEYPHGESRVPESASERARASAWVTKTEPLERLCFCVNRRESEKVKVARTPMITTVRITSREVKPGRWSVWENGKGYGENQERILSDKRPPVA